jgi:hypothetical protein
MGMSLSLNIVPEHRLMLICKVCEDSYDDHAEWCPQGKIRELVYAQESYGCPDCRKAGGVQINVNDFLECRKCRSLFSSGLYGYGEAYDEGKKQFILIPLLSDDFDACITVWRLEQSLGQGDFVIDHAIKLLVEERECILARKKRKRRMQKKRKNRRGE